MNKKGALISLEALVKFVPAFLIAIVGLFILATLWGAFWTEETSVAQNDFKRVVNNLHTLDFGESINVFTKGQNYRLVLDHQGQDPMCDSKPCLCIQEQIQKGAFTTTDCEIFENVDCSKQGNPKYICINQAKTLMIHNVNPAQKDFVNINKDTKGKITFNVTTKSI